MPEIPLLFAIVAKVRLYDFMKIILEIIAGPMTGEKFELSPGVYLFGRSKDADIRTDNDDKAISRKHFEIRLSSDGDCSIRHLSKTNPTYVNAAPVSESKINDHDTVKIGHTTLRFLVQNGQGNSFHCYKCSKDLSTQANSDGRGKELYGKVMYCCPACLPSFQFIKGDKIDKFQLLQHIATGGMGAVYLVYHEETCRLLILKKMLNSLDIDIQKKHFEREISIHRQLNHENIIHCIETGFQGNTPYMILEYADKGNLHDYYIEKEFNVPVKESVGYFLEAIQGCLYLHSYNPPVIHRDIKPWNLLIHNERGHNKIKISDFGLSKFFDKEGLAPQTKVGDIKGSVAFMSPQQLGNPIIAGCQDDIFSLGVTFYYLMSGKLPYHYPSAFETHQLSMKYRNNRVRLKEELAKLGKNGNLHQIVMNGLVVPLENKAPGINRNLAGIINRCIAVDPQVRFKTFGEIREQLHNCYL
jgi:serine/threonine protein kinase